MFVCLLLFCYNHLNVFYTYVYFFSKILIAILINWLLCGILTATGALTDNPNHLEYKTRTDARSGVISDSPWFNLPYPGERYKSYLVLNPSLHVSFILICISRDKNVTFSFNVYAQLKKN